MDLKQIRSVVDALAGSAASEVRLKTADLEIELRFSETASSLPAAVMEAPALGLSEVAATLPGVVYLAPSSGAAPFAARGTVVAKGDTLMLVEAMKSMLLLTAPSAGVVEEVLVTDEEVVREGQVVLRLRPVTA